MDTQLHKIALGFKAAGYQLYEVGGHVRDSLLKIPSNDIDLATDALPHISKQILAKFGNVYTIGEEYGTVGISNEEQIEITTYRDEVYPTNSRKPGVVFGKSLKKDLSRRDFTINAIARDPLTNEIFDPFNGLEDLKKSQIRCVGKDDVRFNEDPLRMMRAIRFACQLKFALNVTMRFPERISIVSNERIQAELCKILLSSRAVYGMEQLYGTKLLSYILPEFAALRFIAQPAQWHTKDVYKHSLMVLDKGCRIDHGDENLIFRLACLLHDIGKPECKTESSTGIHFYNHQIVGAVKAKEILQRLKFDRDTIDRVANLISFHMQPLMLLKDYENDGLAKRSIIRLIRRVGEKDIELLLDLVQCDIKVSKNSRTKFVAYLRKLVAEAMLDTPEAICSPLSGNEIMVQFRLSPSKIIGDVKGHLTNLVIDGKLGKDDKIGAINEVRKLLEAYCILFD